VRNAKASINHWLGTKLSDVTLSFTPGEPAVFPSVVVLFGKMNEAAKTRNPSVLLAEFTVTADAWANGGNLADARELAGRIKEALLGDSDVGERIPRYAWNFGANPPAPGSVLDLMEVTRVSTEEIFDRALPDLRRVQVKFNVRARISGGN